MMAMIRPNAIILTKVKRLMVGIIDKGYTVAEVLPLRYFSFVLPYHINFMHFNLVSCMINPSL